MTRALFFVTCPSTVVLTSGLQRAAGETNRNCGVPPRCAGIIVSSPPVPGTAAARDGRVKQFVRTTNRAAPFRRARLRHTFAAVVTY